MRFATETGIFQYRYHSHNFGGATYSKSFRLRYDEWTGQLQEKDPDNPRKWVPAQEKIIRGHRTYEVLGEPWLTSRIIWQCCTNFKPRSKTIVRVVNPKAAFVPMNLYVEDPDVGIISLAALLMTKTLVREAFSRAHTDITGLRKSGTKPTRVFPTPIKLTKEIIIA